MGEGIIQFIRTWIRKRKEFQNYFYMLYQNEIFKVSPQYKLDFRLFKYIPIFLTFNSLLLSGIAIKLYPRNKAFVFVGLICYVNICWHFLWVQNIYKSKISKSSEPIGYWLRKEYRKRFGQLHAGKEDEDFEQIYLNPLKI